MEQENVQGVRNVDVVHIQKKLDEGYIFSEDSKGRDLILIIGNTGVGKSTACNYLCGYPMKEVKHGHRFVIDTVDETSIKIGHTVQSETLYAKCMSVNDTMSKNQLDGSLCLVDCPGFFGNRTIEEKVVESISTELAIRNARQIKGILILISLNTLLETAIGELRELVKTLISLFKDPIEMVQYSVFIITKKNKYMSVKEAEEVTIGAMGSLKHYCEEQAARLFENQNLSSCDDLTYSEYNKIATYFSCVLEKRDAIIFIDPLDSGESKNIILDKINCIKTRKKGSLKDDVKTEINPDQIAKNAMTDQICPITIDDFNFSEYDKHRILFNKALYHLAGDGLKLINEIHQGAENIQKYLSEISDVIENVKKLYDEQSTIQEDLHKASKEKSQHLKQTFESVHKWKLMIGLNNYRIESKEKKIQDIDKVKSILKEELRHIDNDQPFKFMEKSIKKEISWWKIFGWEEMEFSAYTENGIPIIHVDKHMQNGRFYEEIDGRNNGHYAIKYRSNYGARPAVAWVATYIKTKHEEGNRINIERYKQSYADLMKEQDNLELEIFDLKSNNNTIELNIKEVEMNANGYEDAFKRRLQDSMRDMDYYNSERNKKIKAIMEIKALGLTNIERFNENRHKYSVLININALINFPSSLITSFVNEYNKFLSDVNKYQSYFSQNDAINSFNNEEEKALRIKDTCAIKEITERVTSGAEVAYDENSIPKQFDIDNSIPKRFDIDNSEDKSPFLSKQEDEFLTDNFQSDFDGKDSINLDFCNGEEGKTLKLEDPLTGREIKDIVVTLAGTLFDKHSLLKQFNTSNPENISPFIFKRGDGFTEEIKYLSWKELSKEEYQNLISCDSFSSESFSMVTKSEVDQMTNENLKEENYQLVQEIKKIKEQLKEKEIELQKAYRKLEEHGLRPRDEVLFKESNF